MKQHRVLSRGLGALVLAIALLTSFLLPAVSPSRLAKMAGGRAPAL